VTTHSIGWEELTYLAVDGTSWDNREVDLPDELVLRNERALAVLKTAQAEILEYWRAAPLESKNS
jgi:hypothetical protein